MRPFLANQPVKGDDAADESPDMEAAKLAAQTVPRAGRDLREGRATRKRQPGNTRRGQEDGRLYPLGGTQEAGILACGRISGYSGSQGSADFCPVWPAIPTVGSKSSRLRP